jgi:DNA-directed RNA polymerase specialized sigma24 family protein
MGGNVVVQNRGVAPVVKATRSAATIPTGMSGTTGTSAVAPTAAGVSFEAWYPAIHPRLVAAMALSCGRPEDAADAADEALARALERWDVVSRMASPDGWTFQVAYNLLRRRGRRQVIEQRVLRRAGGGVATSVPAPAGEAWDAVKDLPRRQREVVVLRYIADLPEAEIAAVLGISRGTVSSTLADARRALGPMLDDEPEETS